jgi:hypothetical protein
MKRQLVKAVCFYLCKSLSYFNLLIGIANVYAHRFVSGRSIVFRKEGTGKPYAVEMVVVLTRSQV